MKNVRRLYARNYISQQERLQRQREEESKGNKVNWIIEREES